MSYNSWVRVLMNFSNKGSIFAIVVSCFHTKPPTTSMEYRIPDVGLLSLSTSRMLISQPSRTLISDMRKPTIS
jgi:hypothetical protein